MLFPSRTTFESLECDISDYHWKIIDENASSGDSEYLASIVLSALENKVPVADILALPNFELSLHENFTETAKGANPKLTQADIDGVFWSVPTDYKNVDFQYILASFLRFGDNFPSLLISLRKASKYIPHFIPVSWWVKFFAGEKALREEGIVLSLDISMVLFGKWTLTDVIDFLVRKVDMDTIMKLNSYGIDDLQEIADIDELLPPDWLDEFFNM